MATKRKPRDEQVRRRVVYFAGVSGLTDLKFRPALQALARLSMLTERSYEHLKGRESLLGADGELCRSLDTFRRLVDSQSTLLLRLGLMPGAEMREPDFEAAFSRVAALQKVDDGPKPNGADSESAE